MPNPQEDVLSFLGAFLRENGLKNTAAALVEEAARVHSEPRPLRLPVSDDKSIKRGIEAFEDLLSHHHVASKDGTERGFSTKVLHFDSGIEDPYGASNVPLYQTATFAQVSATEFGPYDYTRSGNPTRSALEKQVAKLDGGVRGFAFTSGMAALSAISRLVSTGDEILLCDDSYGGTFRLLSKITSRLGVSVRYVDMEGAKGVENLKKELRSSTKLVMLESPSNPLQRIMDIASIAEVVHANKNGCLLSVDNTMLSPVLMQPLKLGADIVMHSATKFMSGHSDTMAGVVVVRDSSLAEQVYFIQNAEGTGLAPFDAWLILRGLKTMPLRVMQQQKNALSVARYLDAHPSVKSVSYAGLEGHVNKALHDSQASGAGSVVCFLTNGRTEEEALKLSRHIIKTTTLFKVTVSFGNVNSLISLPGAMSHASIPEEVRKARHFPENIVRLSIGIEDVGDLIRDLDAAFSSFVATTLPPTPHVGGSIHP